MNEREHESGSDRTVREGYTDFRDVDEAIRHRLDTFIDCERGELSDWDEVLGIPTDTASGKATARSDDRDPLDAIADHYDRKR